MSEYEKKTYDSLDKLVKSTYYIAKKELIDEFLKDLQQLDIQSDLDNQKKYKLIKKWEAK